MGIFWKHGIWNIINDLLGYSKESWPRITKSIHSATKCLAILRLEEVTSQWMQSKLDRQVVHYVRSKKIWAWQILQGIIASNNPMPCLVVFSRSCFFSVRPICDFQMETKQTKEISRCKQTKESQKGFNKS